MKNVKILLIYVLYSMIISLNTLNASVENEPGLHIKVIENNSDDKHFETFISFDTIKKMQLDSIEVEESDRTWIGAKFMHILQENLQISPEQVKKLTISATDGYSSVLSGDLLKSIKTAVCAYKIEDKPQWPEEYSYMRFVFPELHLMYWINGPKEVEIILNQNNDSIRSYYFYLLDNQRFNKLMNSDLDPSQYIAIEDIINELPTPLMNFNLLTEDGLVREYPHNEISRYFVLQNTNDNSWVLNGVNVPSGLKLEDVIFLNADNHGIFLKTMDIDEQEKWHKLFWMPIFADFPDGSNLQIESFDVVGEKQSSLSVKFSENSQKSFYEIINSELQRMKEIDFVKVSW